jgi:hypothetical protein
MYRNFVFLIFLICLLSCNTKEKHAINQLIIPANDGVGPYLLNDFAESSELVIVNLPENISLVRASKVISLENVLYIFDIPKNQILVVDQQTGDFLYEISNYGEGPLEYLGISDFDVTEPHQLFIRDLANKLLRYDHGQVKQNNSITVKSRGIAMLNKEQLISIQPIDDKIDINLPVYSISNNSLVKYLTKSPVVGGFGIPPVLSRRYSRNNITLNEFYSNSLIYLENEVVTDSVKVAFDSASDGIRLLYFLDWPRHKLIVAERTLGEEEGTIYTTLFRDGQPIQNIAGFMNNLDGLPIAGLPDAFSSTSNEIIMVYSDEIFQTWETQARGPLWRRRSRRSTTR